MKMFLREKQRKYAVEVLITEQLVKNCALLPDPTRTPGASLAKKIRLLEKKLGRKPATPPPPNHLKKFNKNLCIQVIVPIFANYC